MNKIEQMTKDDLLNYSLGQKVNIHEELIKDIDKSVKLDSKRFRLRKISKIVFDKDEDSIHKLTTIFSTINSLGSDLMYILHNEDAKLTFYIGVMDKNSQDLNNSDKTLEQVFNSNFSGCNISKKFLGDSEEIKNIENILANDNAIVSMATTVPSFKDEDEQKENFVQGLEKFLLAMQDKNYTTILLAKNISNVVETRKAGYEELYTQLFPLVTKDMSFGTNFSESLGTSDSEAFSLSLNESTTKTISTGSNEGESIQKPSVLQKVQMTGIPTALAVAVGGLAMAGGAGPLLVAGGAAASLLGTLGAASVIKKVDKNNNWFDSKNTTTSTTHNNSDGKTKSKGSSQTKTRGKNTNETKGESLQTTIKFEDKFFKNQVDSIDMQLERIKQSQNYGMFDFAAYFISEDTETSNTAANIYNSLIRGDESFLGNSYVIPFDYDNSKIVCKYLANFEHPKFKIDNESISISTMINSKELAIAMNLPKKSLHGLFVKESVEFGREIIFKTNDNTINIGKIHHLGKETKQNVELSQKDFAMHTLVTGATGSGKSTTTYKLIDELRKANKKFLVIEPTKGEYKHIFGNEKDVSVYGTNNKYSPLLIINPFSFPTDEIHILEHIDRLIEIFNACWPMYAAMPAVLKDAVLKAYENCGWDLEESDNKELIFPTFEDVLVSLNDVLDSSLYSENTKSDYKGALITRIQSLTQGLIGKIFDEDEIGDEALFDENVVIDISRVGSSETKSLIMGILLLKLNQYRMAKGDMNSELKHITVLEEAHHLLPRVSTESSSEAGNIKGKAVEMLSNAIAEMRTYGEGFIIVDQSPNMLDISAIRNTNTKIIMRLSELDDRKDIGKSATLSDEQIDEIPKLDRGVAVVYQNGWEEAILCKVQISDVELKSRNMKYSYTPIKNCMDRKKILTNIVKILALNGTKILEEERQDILKEYLSNKINYELWAGNNLFKKQTLEHFENNNKIATREKAQILNRLLSGKLLRQQILGLDSAEVKKTKLSSLIEKKIYFSDKLFEWQVISLINIANSVKEQEMIEEVEMKLAQQKLI